MDKCKVLKIIRSYPTKRGMLKVRQAELSRLMSEREAGISSLPCSLGKTDGGGSGISDTTYRKTEKAMRYDPEIEALRETVEELRRDVELVEHVLTALDPISRMIVELREMPEYNDKKCKWERRLTWEEIASKVSYSVKQCQRIYETAIIQLIAMMSRNVS